MRRDRLSGQNGIAAGRNAASLCEGGSRIISWVGNGCFPPRQNITTKAQRARRTAESYHDSFSRKCALNTRRKPDGVEARGTGEALVGSALNQGREDNMVSTAPCQ